MIKVRALVVLLVLTVSLPAYAGNFKVRSAKEYPREAVLVNEDTGSELLVREGDRIEGSIVREISWSHVTMTESLGPHRAIVTQIPVSR